MVNIDRLKSALRNRGISIEQASEAIDMNPSTFYRRLNRQGEKFTVQEVAKLASLLNLSSETMQGIFFDGQLAETQVRGSKQ